MIFENHTFKMKFFALLIVFLLLSATSYKRSFRTLFETLSEYKDLSQKSKLISEKSNDIAKLNSELSSLDKVIGKKGVSKEKIQQEIISFVSSINIPITIYDLQPVHEHRDGNYIVYTNQLDITGDYNSLLKVSYEFEKNFIFSKVVSLHFYTLKKGNNPDILHQKIIFQNYESIN